MREVLILGGYGNFGKRIALALARHGVPIIIAGRNGNKAQALAAQIHASLPDAVMRTAALDADDNPDQYLQLLKPGVVINACGPFQNKDYRVAEACTRQKIHYIDLADGRSFVTGITGLDKAAGEAGVSVISGASTVPGLSSAVLDHYRHEFSTINELRYGIGPGQKAERGLSTTQGILTYVGKPLKPASGSSKPRYGWQDIYRQPYPELGNRWMANCDIPDLDLFPEKYGIKEIQFSAGIENTLLHLGIWGLSWLVRAKLPVSLSRHAAALLRISHWFDRLGTDAGGMHVIMHGKDRSGAPYERQWFIIAKNGDGPQIPCIPAIFLAKKLAEGIALPVGATPCLGLIGLDEYIAELSRFSIMTFEKSFGGSSYRG